MVTGYPVSRVSRRGRGGAVVYQKVRKAGNSYVVTIPKEEMEKQGLKEGDMVGVEVRKMEVTMRPRLSPGLAATAERLMERFDADLRYLADR